ncbi:MAG: Crp/Fnr family transcriptional regulator [Hyphomicrobiaceae bacterium]
MISVALEYSDDTQASPADANAGPGAVSQCAKANNVQPKEELAPPAAAAEGALTTGDTKSAGKTGGSEYLALQDMEILFRAGDTRTAFFRVEAGALLIAADQTSSEADNFRVATAGEFVGLGFQACHSTTACAVNSATVACIPFEELDNLKSSNLSLQLQLTKDVTREFAERKRALIAESVDVEPVKKVARLLLAMSSLAEHEGRAINVVAEALECKFLADLIGLRIEVLEDAVEKLARAGVLYTSALGGAVVNVNRAALATYT